MYWVHIYCVSPLQMRIIPHIQVTDSLYEAVTLWEWLTDCLIQVDRFNKRESYLRKQR